MSSIALCFIVTIASMGSLWFNHKTGRSLQRLQEKLQHEHKHRVRLECEVAALLSCSRTLGNKVKENLKQQRALIRQIDNIELNEGGSDAVEHAAELLDKGIAMEEVAKICELSQGEVDLLSKFSGLRHAA